MKTKGIIIILIGFLGILPYTKISAQRNPSSHESFVSGFVQKIAGNEIKYTSGVEGVDEALITRADAGDQVMTWKSAPVNDLKGTTYITYVLYIGYDSKSPGTVFNFFVDKEKQGEIALPNNKLSEWIIELQNGESLNFKRHFVDSNNDNYGFLYYKVPAKNLKKNQVLELEITGAKEGEMTWFMVFKKNLSESLNLISVPSIIEKNGKEYQTIQIEVNYLKPPSEGTILVNGEEIKKVKLETGIQSYEIMLPRVGKEENVKVALESEELVLRSEVILKPIKKWNINFVQHSHTDIGYTRTQMEILAEHLRYIDYALDYCDITDDYPETSKFRWTCEASWAVDEYLNSRPKSQIDRLKQRIKEGRIEVTGMYFNFSELPDEQTLAASLAPIKSITKRNPGNLSHAE